jgi:site-specific DNA-methyltransferase (adenine-specific)
VTPYYEENGITIYCADSREVLPYLQEGSVDLVLTSPPYNLSNGNRFHMGHKGSSRPGAAISKGYASHGDDMPYEKYVDWQQGILRECWRLLSDEGAIFYNHKPRVQFKALQTPLALNPGLPLRQIIIWAGGGGVNYSESHYMPAHEWILVLAKEAFKLRDRSASGVGDVWRIPPEIGSKHPAPFPLRLALRAIETTPAKTVLDPFCGSGTTLRAAKDLGRSCIGIEIEERYCEIAAERLRQSVLQFEGVA